MRLRGWRHEAGHHAAEKIRDAGVGTAPEQEVLHLGVTDVGEGGDDAVQLLHPLDDCAPHE
eukprot:331719-Prorocentrum_minimum.AAC.1